MKRVNYEALRYMILFSHVYLIFLRFKDSPLHFVLKHSACVSLTDQISIS